MQVFHYAPWARLLAIVASDCLRPSNAGAPDEVPLLWFSLNQTWEPTATKMVLNDAGQMIQMTFCEQLAKFGCIRFGMAADGPGLLQWKDACALAGIKRDMRRNLERVGRKKGADPAHWFAVAREVPLSELDQQVFARDVWHPAQPAEAAEAWTKTRAT